MENGEEAKNGDGDNSKSMDGKPESQLTEDTLIIHVMPTVFLNVTFNTVVS